MIFASCTLFLATKFKIGPGHVAILTYHDVVPKRTQSSLWFDCSVSELKQQIAYIKSKHVRFVSLDEVAAHLLDDKSIGQKAVAITFADNYEGFYKYSWPILKANNIPVSMFVHTGFVGDRHGRPKMTWGQLQELSKNKLFSTQSQSVTHPADISQLPMDSLNRELALSRTSLRQHGLNSAFFAYPNGKFSPACYKPVDRAGYSLAFCEEWGLAENSRDPMAVNRYVHTQYKRAIKALMAH